MATDSSSSLSRADLHVHSRYSDRPSEWILRRIGAPECFTEPIAVYERARGQGMDFVTISDHDSIRGALEIAHLPGVFVSSEVTAAFPEDGCRVHILVFGIDELQHREIERLRSNVYELRDYLLDERIVHSVAHPLFSVNDQLTVEHLEKLIVLFKRFEAINGTRESRAATIARTIFAALTPAMMEELADRHRLDSRDPEPWVKHLTAGSDDHSGLYIASAHVETPRAETVEAFLSHLAAGLSRPAGDHGSSLKLARSFYSIAHRYYRERLLGGVSVRTDLFIDLVAKILGDQERVDLRPSDRLRLLAVQWIRPRKRSMGTVDRAVLRDLTRLAGLEDDGSSVPLERRCFQVATSLSQRLAYASLKKGSKHLRRGKLTEAIQSVSSLGPVALCVAPYLAAFHTQHKDERLLQAAAARFPSTHGERLRSPRKAWFTDTFRELNGVASTVRACAERAQIERRELTVITCDPAPDAEAPACVHNFKSLGGFKLPEYQALKLQFPPFLEILEYCERERFSEIVLSTPGPLGLAGLLAGRLLGARVTGIYHTDFPAYVRSYTGSAHLEGATRRYLRWFYEQADRLFVPSHAYLEALVDEGFAPEKLAVLERGVDSDRFHPSHRERRSWSRYGLGEGFKFLYVGRVAKEKNLERLLEAFVELRRGGLEAGLVIVGDGPHRRELERQWALPEIAFTGFLRGEDLSRAYASADLFVFPSTTDTFGNVVLEAHASGLPAIVSESGGAQEIVRASGGGLVVPVDEPGALAAAMARLYEDEAARAEMAVAGVAHAARVSWSSLLDSLWEEPGLVTSTPHRRHRGVTRRVLA